MASRMTDMTIPGGLRILDVELKGNLVRLYLGAATLADWWGDDWDDAPYEHNAGVVGPEYVSHVLDVAYPFDAHVVEPCSGTLNSPWSKADMQQRRVAMFAVVPPKEAEWGLDYWDAATANAATTRIYMGDQPSVATTIPGAAILALRETGDK